MAAFVLVAGCHRTAFDLLADRIERIIKGCSARFTEKNGVAITLEGFGRTHLPGVLSVTLSWGRPSDPTRCAEVVLRGKDNIRQRIDEYSRYELQVSNRAGRNPRVLTEEIWRSIQAYVKFAQDS